LTADAPPAHETPPVPETVAGDQASRIVPAQWMPVAPAIAWLAFGSAEDDLDAAYYFGASIWHAAEPDDIAEWLAEIEDGGEFPVDIRCIEFTLLERRVIDRAAQTASFLTAMAEVSQKRAEEKARAAALGNPKLAVSIPSPELTADHYKEAATQLLEELEACQSVAATQHAALWNASETLRRAVANGEIRAFGWRGHGPDFSDQTKPLPLRERIPDDLFAAPVTITQHGLLSFARGDGTFGNYEVLWSYLLIDSEELLRVHPYVPDDRPSVVYTPPVPEFKRDIGGIDAYYDWLPFEEECRKYLQSLSAKPAGRDPKRQLKTHMRWWAKNKMEPKNDDTRPTRRTVDRKTNDLFQKLMAEVSQGSGHNRT
jgi:hypothetical protein